MPDYIVSGSDLTSVADAIRTKGNTSSPLSFPTEFVSAIGAISGSSNWELIGEKTMALTEYTDTSIADSVDTLINISNTSYAWILVIITCDALIESSTEWGMSVQICGRRTNGKISAFQALQQLGFATLNSLAITNNPISANNVGVWVLNDSDNITIERKCNGSSCVKCRSGNYTIKAYGLTTV